MTRHRFEYLWQDSENYKRPTKMPAPEYIEHLMAWVQGNIDNESMFPSRIGTSRTMASAPSSLSLVAACRFHTPRLIADSRRAFRKDFSISNPTAIQTTLSSLCTYLLPSLSCHHPTRIRAAPQHQFQTLRLVHRRA